MKQSIYITGVAGTGKTTICNELKKKGINAFDIGAIPGVCYWRNKSTKEKTTYPAPADTKWLEENERICNEDVMEEFIAKQEGDVVITGIVVGNQDEFIGMFDKVLLLRCPPDILINRLQTRVNKSGFGKNGAEQNAVLIGQEKFEKKTLAQGAVPIISQGTIQDTVDKVLAHI